MTTFGKKWRGWTWWKLGTYECLVCWAIQSLWCVYISLYIHNIYTIYTHVYIYFYLLKMKFPICSFSCFVLARKTHTSSSFSINSAWGHWRPTSDCGARVVFVSWAPGESQKWWLKTRRWRMEWKKRKHLFIAGRTFFPSFFLPEIFLLWSFISYFVFSSPVGNWLA